MSISDLVQTDFETSIINLESSTRSFQRSIIIKQDTNKSGVISLLEDDTLQLNQTSVSNQPSSQGQTMRPTTSESGYNR